MEPLSLPPVVAQVPLPPTTTRQEDITSAAERAAEEITTAGQRRINLIWEVTQSAVAIMITAVALTTVLLSKEIPTWLYGVINLVFGFYFARTNHQAIGGVGKKPSEKYTGR